jgi:hypothetical protein
MFDGERALKDGHDAGRGKAFVRLSEIRLHAVTLPQPGSRKFLRAVTFLTPEDSSWAVAPPFDKMQQTVNCNERHTPRAVHSEGEVGADVADFGTRIMTGERDSTEITCSSQIGASLAPIVADHVIAATTPSLSAPFPNMYG